MARQPAVDRTREDREARRNANNVELVARFLDHQFRAARLGWRQKDAVGRAGNVFFRSENADVAFHFVVVRREIFVSDGPIVAEAVARGGFEIDGGKAQRNAPPVIGAAADDARTKPLKTRAGSGSVGFAFNSPSTIGGKELAEIFARVTADAGAAMRGFIRPHQHLEIFFRIYVGSSFQQRAVQATLCENLGGHASARAGADDANVILLWRTNHLGHGTLSPYRLFFLSSETAKSQARAVRAMYVSEGFTQAAEVMHAPSVMKRFFASCV